MNNFELDEQAKILSDTLTPYALARRVIELEGVIREYDGYKDKLMDEYDILINTLEFQGIDVDDILTVYESRGAYSD